MSRPVNVRYGSIETHIIAWLIVALLACSGCGIRKVDNEINKSKEKDNTEQTSNSEKQSESKESKVEESSQDNDKKNDIVETTTTTKYDMTGKPTETTTTTKTDKSIDKTKYKNKTVTNNTLRTVEKEKTIVITIKEKETFNKKKDVETDRNGVYWMAGIVLVIGLVLWLKPWK